MKRSDFPMIGNGIYLDSAATAHKPQSVIDAVSSCYASHYGTVHRAVYDLSIESTRRYQQAREVAGAFINASDSSEIIFSRGTTESINLIARCYEHIGPGDEILITEAEHHSNIVPWQILCQKTKATLKVASITEKGEIDQHSFASHLSESTKIVSIAHVSNVLGTIHPIKELIKQAHRFGAVVVIDGAQAISHLPVDVQDLNADFYTFSAHKLYGPTGIGILYGKKELLLKMPPFLGGGDMIDQVTFQETTYSEPPLKFEAGTPNIAGAIGLKAAIEYVQKIDFDEIEKHESHLLHCAKRKLQNLPLRIIGEAENKSAIISFLIDGIHPFDIGTLLNLRGISIRTGHLCAQPLMRRFNTTSMCRISFGLYNTEEEVEQFAAALTEVISLLSP